MIDKNKTYKIVLIDNHILYRQGEWFYDGDIIDEDKLQMVRYYEAT